MGREQCIIAIDRPDAKGAVQLLQATRPWFVWYKIGLQLFLAEGADILKPFRAAGKKIFLDLKLHDIPNTVHGAAASLRRLAPDLLTVHASGGAEMIAAAVDGLGDAGRVIAVTVLTSLAEHDSTRLFAAPPATLARRWLQEAQSAGAAGFVCSPQEVCTLKSLWPQGVAITPGIRFANADADDQARVATPGRAIADGADFVVLGRAVTGAADPAAAIRRLDNSLATGS